MPIIGGRQVGVRGLGFQGAGKPNAPTGVTATDVGTGRAYNNGAATVSFTPGSSNGAPITQYTVTSSPGGYTNTGVSSPITVTGLQSNTSYTFTVTATNAVGTSDAGTSNSITATTVPQAPTIGTASDGGTGTTATVAYTENATGGKAVSVYTATSSPGSFTGTGASPITVSGLTTGTAYTFTVTATNANGTSAASTASNSVTPELPPSYESIATATGVGSSTITFSSIPNTYKNLQLRFIGRSTTNSGGIDLIITYNGSTTGYVSHWLEGSGSGTPTTNYSTNPGAIYLGSVLTGAATTANIFGTGIININEYSNTSKTKTTFTLAGKDTNSSGSYLLHSNLWNNTSAINSITLTTSSGNFVSGTSIALYGIKG